MKLLAALFLTSLLTCSWGFGNDVNDDGDELPFLNRVEDPVDPVDPVDRNGVSIGQGDVALVKQNYANTMNAELNHRINSSLVCSHVYLSMAYWFDRADVALPGFHKYFLARSHKSRDDVEILMSYINKRGGCIRLKRVKKPPHTWENGLTVMEAALGMEKELNKNMLKMHQHAKIDSHLTHFIESNFLEPKVDLIKELADYVTRLKAFKGDYFLGEFILDKDLQS